MAIAQPIPRKPGDRSIEALWRYAESIEREMQRLSQNIESDNIRPGAVTMEKLSDDVKHRISGEAGT